MSDQRSPSHLDDDADTDPAGRRLGPTSFVLIGLLVGLLLGVVLIWVLRGNPFSAANEVVYSEVVVGSVADEDERICWAEDPERRDSPQTCAILALDPELDVPAPGDRVTIGLVEFRTPDGAEFSQVVHVAPVTQPVEPVIDGTDETTEPLVPTDAATPSS